MSLFLYIVHFILAYFSSVAFSIIFNMPRKELYLCGITGAAGWVLLQFAQKEFHLSSSFAMFLATLLITLLSRTFAFQRKEPITVYLIAGCIPLVPGYGVFYTMRDIVNNDYLAAATQGIETIKVGGVMVVGMMIVFALPWRLFRPIYHLKEWRKSRTSKTL